MVFYWQDESEWPTLPVLPSYGRGRDAPDGRFSSLIFGTNLTDVVITGKQLFQFVKVICHWKSLFMSLFFVDKVTMGQLMDKDITGGTSSTRVN